MQRRGLWAAGGVVLLLLLLVGVVAVLSVGTGFAKDEAAAGAKCSEATLHGTYLDAYDGFDITGNEQVPFAAAEYQVYDGNGNVNGVFSANFNGDITRKEPFSGTYTVKADCTATVTFADGTQYDLFVAPDGSMFTFVQTNPPEQVTSGVALRGTAKRVGD
jgi:hypothetical protein